MIFPGTIQLSIKILLNETPVFIHDREYSKKLSSVMHFTIDYTIIILGLINI